MNSVFEVISNNVEFQLSVAYAYRVAYRETGDGQTAVNRLKEEMHKMGVGDFDALTKEYEKLMWPCAEDGLDALVKFDAMYQEIAIKKNVSTVPIPESTKELDGQKYEGLSGAVKLAWRTGFRIAKTEYGELDPEVLGEEVSQALFYKVKEYSRLLGDGMIQAAGYILSSRAEDAIENIYAVLTGMEGQKVEYGEIGLIAQFQQLLVASVNRWAEDMRKTVLKWCDSNRSDSFVEAKEEARMEELGRKAIHGVG